jgi:hypothetical protein
MSAAALGTPPRLSSACESRTFSCSRSAAALDAFDAAHPTRDASWAAWQQQRRAAAAQRGMSAAAAERQAALHWVAMFVDDQMGGSADDLLFDRAGRPVIGANGLHTRRSTAHFALARDAIERFGWESAPDKEQPPAEVVEVLGAEVNLALGRWRLADAKRVRYSRLARQVAQPRYIRYDDILSLLGKLTFAAQCYPLGKQHLHASWRMARARYRMADGLDARARLAQRRCRARLVGRLERVSRQVWYVYGMFFCSVPQQGTRREHTQNSTSIILRSFSLPTCTCARSEQLRSMFSVFESFFRASLEREERPPGIANVGVFTLRRLLYDRSARAHCVR